MTATNHQPAIILVRPQMGENIGAAARAMLNFGLTDLRLVAPRDGWPNTRANDMSSGALEHFEPTLYDDLGAALSDCQYGFATTARTRDMEKTAFTPLSATENSKDRAADGQKVAFVFGPERTGLENNDIALCHALVHVPTNPDFSSLNLGQSVLLLCYQYFSLEHAPIAQSKSEIVPLAQFDELLTRLEAELDQRRFFRNPDLKESALQNIRTMLLRSEMTDQETRTFHGIISALIGNKIRD